MHLKRHHLLALATVLALAGLVVAGVGGRGDVPAYLTAPVERGDVVSTVTATGTLNAVVTVRVGSQLSGQIQDLLVDFNDAVQRDQPIARLDSKTYAARRREAEAALEVARTTVLIQEAAVERARAELANARAGRAVADAQLQSAAARRGDAARERARKRTLRERGNVTLTEVDRALTEDESAAALLQAAEAEREVRGAAILAVAAGLRMSEANLQNVQAAVR